ncbi:hypothetical protein [Pueribacillus sp. YX66]|uniref:hypothetical protein n=1 Tax=Pueribacillus sp. YX66 TaxID=3229242 RepID=UPI00358D6060
MSEEHEDLTMKQRIDAFYRQSGGPGSPEIAKILNEHLIYGKDHGVRGKKEDVRDAFTEVFLSDRSTQPVVLGLMKLRNAVRQEWERYLEARRSNLDEKLEQLKREKIE